jgi:hypothetical protein
MARITPQTSSVVTNEKNTKSEIDFRGIITQKYPLNGEDYAIQLWHKTYHNAFARCTEKYLDDDNENAYLVINLKGYSVNIRTGKIKEVA